MMKTAIAMTLLLYAAIFGGVYMFWKHVEQTVAKSYSWDQENLKREDHGCPTAIFVAPGGELNQCP